MATNLKAKSRAKSTTKASAARDGEPSRDRSTAKAERKPDAGVMAIQRMMAKQGRSAAERARIDALSDDEFQRELRDYRDREDSRAAAAEAAERKDGRRRYEHTAYWHAKQAAKIREKRKAARREKHRRDPFLFSNEFIEDFAGEVRLMGGRFTICCNPLNFAAGLSLCMAADFGYLAYDTVRRIADPAEREKAMREIRRSLRVVRRPFYYARETERRRRLAAERRKIRRRTTLAPCPTAEGLLGLWRRRKESKENMILLGGMLQDLECYVDNRLRYDDGGAIVGRNGGIRGWLRDNLPELFPRYKTLMRYKAMAIKLRQATETKDPTPTSALLDAEPRCELVKELLEDFRTTFSFLEHEIDVRIDATKGFVEKEAERLPLSSSHGKLDKQELSSARRGRRRCRTPPSPH